MFVHGNTWRNLALHHLLTNGSSAVNGCRQKRVQTADKNITIIQKYKQKTVQNSSKQICLWILMWEDKKRWTFSPEEALLWIMNSNIGQKRQFKVKKRLDGFVHYKDAVFHKILIDGLECCGLLWIVVMFYQLFGLSFWWHPFTAEDWWGSDVMVHFSKSVKMKKQSHLVWFERE